MSSSGQPLHQQEWDFYFCELDEHPGSIMLDLGLHHVAPLESRPELLWVSVKMNAPREEDGLSSSGESETLDQIEDRLATHLSRHEAIYAGRLTSNGLRNFYFYLGNSLLHDKSISEAMVAFPGYRFEYGLKEDKEWGAYFEFLYPEREQLQEMYNRRVIYNLEKHGDKLSKPRPVDHWLFFKSEADREIFLEKIANDGFKVENKSQDGGEEFPYCLHISRADRVDPENVDEYTLYLLELAESCNGYYDGWGTQIEKE